MVECCDKRFKLNKSAKKDRDPVDVATLRNLANDVHPDLKVKALRGGIAKLCGQAGIFALRLASLVVLARLLSPRDFGLVAMVTVVTGVYGVFTSAGLASAAIQRTAITHQQISTLFWINILVGVALAFLCVVTAPVLAEFYHEPRLFWVTIAMGVGFVANAAGVQHSAVLERQLRYVTVTAIELSGQLASIVVGIGMALAGLGYWALVGAALTSPAVNTIGMWVATGWIPGAPKWDADVRSMLRFGGTVTLNTLIVYIAYNFDKLLLGRVWGANALGIYGQAYQLINVPTANINVAIGGVAFSALSRLQGDLPRLRSYFLKGYSLAISVTIPITAFSALFADDIIHVVLGPKWEEAVEIFRLLTPTILIFGIINPLAWLLLSVGLERRSLHIAMVIAPVVIVSFMIGLPFGPAGVAFAYSAGMTLLLVPTVLWCLHGTTVSPKDLFVATLRPLLAGLSSVALAACVLHGVGELASPVVRLLVAGSVTIIGYAGILLFVMGQMKFYSGLLRAVLTSTPQYAR
jgi:PST family polysaccharide transporter